MFVIRAVFDNFSLRFSAYLIKGLILVLKKEYTSYHKANQSFISLCLRETIKTNLVDKNGTQTKKNTVQEENNQISDFSMFNSEYPVSDSYDPRLFGTKILTSPYKEDYFSNKSKEHFVSSFGSESHNKTIKQLLNNNNILVNNKSIQQIDNYKNESQTNSPKNLGCLNDKSHNCNSMMINSNDRMNDFSSININNNQKSGLNIDINNHEELLSNFIDFDYDFNLNGYHHNKNKTNQNNQNIEANNTSNNKDYITPIKLITFENKPKEILKRLNSTRIDSIKALNFSIKDKSNTKLNLIKQNLEYDENCMLYSLDITNQKNNLNQSDVAKKMEEEYYTYQRLFQKVFKETIRTFEYNKFKNKLNVIEFDKSLLVSEMSLLLSLKDINSKQKKSHQSSYEQLRYGERGDNSLENSASMISNLSLKEVFDTNKKLINKTTAFINYPSIVGVIEEEDSNFNLNSMNTFNLKSTLNNNNNFDLNFENINEEERENEDNFNCNINNNNVSEDLFKQFKALESKKEINLDNIAHYIQFPRKTNQIELKALAFYHLLLYVQKNNANLYQKHSFGSIYIEA